jgi:glycosyltransferase involved in cell wall biosynthesis
MTDMIRTAFTLPDKNRWTGGYQYFVNLFRVLLEHGHGKVRPIVFVGNDVAEEALTPLRADVAEVVRSDVFTAGTEAGRLLDAGLTGRDRRALKVYREHGIRVVFESAAWHGWRFPLPTIAWLPDFQHRRLRHMFGKRAWLQREIGFRAQVMSAAIIMLSSETARRDCEAFYPAALGRIRVTPFAVETGDEAFAVSVAEVRARYSLGAPYFYLPNQIWRHKNHALIIDALQIMRDQDISATVVASGAQVDPRYPGLADELVERVERAGLHDSFRFLRFVPRTDVYALMRGSVAMLNPSLFEGWSTTVEEAKALGVPLVLSDIDVHREQAGPAAYFFDPYRAQDAAAVLGRALEGAANLSGEVSRAEAQAQNVARVKAYASKTEDLIAQVVE